MGYKGTLRSISAAQKRHEREARRRQRELERREKQLAKMQEQERARFEVERYENYVEVLTAIYKECGDVWDWQTVNNRSEPREPQQKWFGKNEEQARLEKDSYSPGRKDRLMRRVESRQKELDESIKRGQLQDQRDYQDALDNYYANHKEWVELQELSNGILANDLEAFSFALELIKPFSEIATIGTSVKITTETPGLFEVALKANGEEIVPAESKSLLKSGKLSVKNMTKTRYYEIYQDYVCGCVLRIARELFALLPTSIVIVTVNSDLLNTSTGHLEEMPILSVAIPRATLEVLNLETLDPSDSMSNFVHNMKFLKTKGVQPVSKVDYSEVSNQV